MDLIYTLSREVHERPSAEKAGKPMVPIPVIERFDQQGQRVLTFCEQHDATVYPTAESAKGAAQLVLQHPGPMGGYIVNCWMRLPSIPGELWGVDANAGRGDTPLEHFAEVADESGWDDYSKLAILSRFIHEHGLTKLFAHYMREQLAAEDIARKEADGA